MEQINYKEPSSRRTSVLAVFSLILAVVTIPSVFFCCGYVTGALAVTFGIIGLVAVNNGEANAASKVMAWAGIIIATLPMVAYALYFIGAIVFVASGASP